MEEKSIERDVQQARIHLFARDSWAPGKFFLCSVVFMILILCILVFVIPRFMEIFESLDVKFPLWTILLMTLSRIVLHHPILSFLTVFALFIMALWVDHEHRLKPLSQAWKKAWFILLFVVLSFSTLFVLFANKPIYRYIDVIK